MQLGFTLAGLIANVCHLMTGRALGFFVPAKEYGLWVFLMVLTQIIAGPYILVRNSVRGAIIEKSADVLGGSLLYDRNFLEFYFWGSYDRDSIESCRPKMI